VTRSVTRRSTADPACSLLRTAGEIDMRLPTDTRVGVAPSNMRGLACARQLVERRDDYRPLHGGGLGL